MILQVYTYLNVKFNISSLAAVRLVK